MDTTELRTQLSDLHAASFGWALSCCSGDAAQAEDVLQMAYVKVLEGRARFGGNSAFKTWLFGVIRNTAREEWRRQRLRRIGLLRFEPEVASEPSPEMAARKSESRERLLRLLEKLSARQREVLHLVFYQDLTVESAAAVMGVSVGSARKHYGRGKARMRELLKDDE